MLASHKTKKLKQNNLLDNGIVILLMKKCRVTDTFVNFLYCMFYSACLSMLTIIVCDFNWNYVARGARI